MTTWGEPNEQRTNGDYDRVYGAKGKGGDDDDDGGEGDEGGVEEGVEDEGNIFAAGGVGLDTNKAMVREPIHPLAARMLPPAPKTRLDETPRPKPKKSDGSPTRS